MNKMQSRDLYQACQKIAIETGVIIETEKKRGYKIIRKSRKELVTEIDLIVQNYLSETLGAINDCDIFYEEDRNQDSKILSKECFIIDPIDATHNLIAGLPFYNLSIGYVYNNAIVFGIIYFPYSKDIYHAYRGEGAYKNLDQLSVSENSVLEKSIVAYDNQFHLSEETLSIFKKIVNKPFTTRILGSAVYDFSLIASGRIDARICNNAKIFDIAAGISIIEEAGGKVTDFEGNKVKLDTKNIVASNSIIHNQILNEL